MTAETRGAMKEALALVTAFSVNRRSPGTWKRALAQSTISDREMIKALAALAQILVGDHAGTMEKARAERGDPAVPRERLEAQLLARAGTFLAKGEE